MVAQISERRSVLVIFLEVFCGCKMVLESVYR